MSSSDWTIFVRDKFRNRVGELSTFKSLDLRIRYNDVSTWQLVVDRRDNLAAELCLPGAGLIIKRFDEIVFSGPWTEQTHDRASGRSDLTLSGVDDTVWLQRRLAYPDPDDITPPYTTQVEDVRTGQASTIMRQFVDENGGLATPVARRIDGLFAGTEVDPFIGPTLTNSGRWQTVLQLLQDIAAASEAAGTPVGFRIIQSGSDLLFELYGSNDYSELVKLSEEMGNLGGFTYKLTAPTRTYAIVGGDGEGTARTYYEKPNGPLRAEWGRIEGELVDSRNAANATELAQTASQALLESGATASLSITPIDIDGMKYGVDYQLGDKVTVALSPLGEPTEQVIFRADCQGSSLAPNYIIVTDKDASVFPIGTRILVYNSDGLLKDPGVRVIHDTNSAFGFTNLIYFPPNSAITQVGDYVTSVKVVPEQVTQVVDMIREVAVTLSSDKEIIAPSIGGTGAKLDAMKIFQKARDLTRRIVNLERR